jgi:hypothetical protein
LNIFKKNKNVRFKKLKKHKRKGRNIKHRSTGKRKKRKKRPSWVGPAKLPGCAARAPSRTARYIGDPVAQWKGVIFVLPRSCAVGPTHVRFFLFFSSFSFNVFFIIFHVKYKHTRAVYRRRPGFGLAEQRKKVDLAGNPAVQQHPEHEVFLQPADAVLNMGTKSGGREEEEEMNEARAPTKGLYSGKRGRWHRP